MLYKAMTHLDYSYDRKKSLSSVTENTYKYSIKASVTLFFFIFFNLSKDLKHVATVLSLSICITPKLDIHH